MSSHVHPPDTPPPDVRAEFLVDGCPRCGEYAADLGLHFDADRFRAFWKKMTEVEYEDVGGYASTLDKQLGRRLYFVSLAIQRAFGFDPRQFLALVGDGPSAPVGSGCPTCGGSLVNWSDSSAGSYGYACLDCRLFVWYSGPGIGGAPADTPKGTHTKPLKLASFPRAYRRIPAYRDAVEWSGP